MISATRRIQRQSVLAALLTVMALTASCANRGDGKEPRRVVCLAADGGTPVDPALLAFLSKARAAHHLADLSEESNRLDDAIADLDRIAGGRTPGGTPPPAEVREVLADTHARLADLKSRRGRFAEAEQDVRRGLRHARETTYFRGHLFEVRGLVAERYAEKLKAQGRIEAAEEQRRRALDSFERSMKIQTEVIDRALPGGTR